MRILAHGDIPAVEWARLLRVDQDDPTWDIRLRFGQQRAEEPFDAIVTRMPALGPLLRVVTMNVSRNGMFDVPTPVVCWWPRGVETPDAHIGIAESDIVIFRTAEDLRVARAVASKVLVGSALRHWDARVVIAEPLDDIGRLLEARLRAGIAAGADGFAKGAVGMALGRAMLDISGDEAGIPHRMAVRSASAHHADIAKGFPEFWLRRVIQSLGYRDLDREREPVYVPV